MMTFDNVVKALIAKFGENTIVRTRDTPEHIEGYVRATGLYKTLYKNRHAGNLVVLNGADSIFNDSTCLNLLKAACDSSDVRKLSWLSNAEMEDEDGESIPNNFVFNGSIIFITNIDFGVAVENGLKMSPPYEALMSRGISFHLKSTASVITLFVSTKF